MSKRERRFVDSEGNVYVPCEPNEFQQRQLRCISGKKGPDGKPLVILDPTCEGPPSDGVNTWDKAKASPYGKYEEEFYRDLYAPPFWEED